MKERIVVAMSGGVDSSVAAALLVEQGYDVVGVTLRVWSARAADDGAERFGACCGTTATDDARAVARALSIPHYVLDSAAEFRRAVIDRFAAEYRDGRTPVPCLACNTELKFGSLLRRAAAWDAAAVATGHYARVEHDARSGRWLLRRALDARKDQTDFLWPLTQAQLAGARFPVGGLLKDEVRAHARRFGLVTADKPESQEICFVPGGDYRAFLRARDPGGFAQGPIVDRAGRKLGTHAGLPAYTVGQRKGLGVTTGRRLYVLDVDPAGNTVTVGEVEELERRTLTAVATNFIACDPPAAPLVVDAKIRHGHVPAPARVRALGDGRAEVVFETAQRAVAPGQSVVFYGGDVVIGGGVIARTPGAP